MSRKKRGLHPHFHVRRTGGVPSLLPWCYDVPMRCQFANYGGQSKKLKEHDIYAQARGRVRKWELHESDIQLLSDTTEPEVVLQHMPKRIFIEMEVRELPRYEDLPEHWVPVPPATT